jgi:hypothetical protein
MQNCNGVRRTADPRIYASASKQSIKPEKYVINPIMYYNCISIKDIPSEVDKPVVYTDVNANKILETCSWLPNELGPRDS